MQIPINLHSMEILVQMNSERLERIHSQAVEYYN